MELPRHGTDLFIEQPLDQRVDILVGRTGRGAVRQTLGHAIQPVQELQLFRRRQYADPTQGVHPRLAGGHVLRPQAVIYGEAAIQRVERFARSQVEAAPPHLVGRGGRRWRGLGRVVGHQSAAATASCSRRTASRPAPILIARP